MRACAISSLCVYEHVHMFLCVCVCLGVCVGVCACVCGGKRDRIQVRGKFRTKMCARACRHGKKNLQPAVCENGVHGICVILCKKYVLSHLECSYLDPTF